MSSDPVSDFLAREQNAMADLNLIGNDEFVQDPQIRSGTFISMWGWPFRMHQSLVRKTDTPRVEV